MVSRANAIDFGNQNLYTVTTCILPQNFRFNAFEKSIHYFRVHDKASLFIQNKQVIFETKTGKRGIRRHKHSAKT